MSFLPPAAGCKARSGASAKFSGQTVLDEPRLQPSCADRAWRSTQCTVVPVKGLHAGSQRAATQVEATSTAWQGLTDAPGQQSQPRQQRAVPAKRAQAKGTDIPPPVGKPLKINLDLLLYQARKKRTQAMRYENPRWRSAALGVAEAQLRQCLAMDPMDGRAYVSLGRILVQQRRFGEARDLYKDGTRLTESNNPYIWAAWAYLEAKQGNVKEARKLYDASTVASPEHAAAWHGWGLLEKKQGNLIRARDIWLKGIRKTQAKPNPFLYQSVAQLAADMGLVEEARKWFVRGTRTLTGQLSHALWVSWALMEAKQGDETAVRYLFKRCLDVGPRSRYLHLAWATWEKEQGNLRNARKLLERGNELNPRDAAILQALGRLEEEAGNIEAARKLFERGTQADPQHLYIWQAWGVMEFRRGNLQRARELFQEGVWADSNTRDVAYVWQAWGVLEKSAGNYQLARQLFRCAVKAWPQSEPAWQAWAQMEEDLGFLARADDLRKYSLEEQQEVVPPRTFADPDQVLEPVLQQIASWLKSFDAASSPRRNRGGWTPDWLAPDGTKLKAPPGGTERVQGPQYPAAAAARAADAAAAAGSRGSDSGAADQPPAEQQQGVGAMLSRQEFAELRQLADSEELELPAWQEVQRPHKQKQQQQQVPPR